MKRSFLMMFVIVAGCASSPSPAPSIDSYQPHSVAAQLDEARAAIERYKDINAAKRDGWKPFGADAPLMGQHWYLENGPDYVSGDTIDFSRPSNLMYTQIQGRMVLTGVAYVVRIGPGEALPEGFDGTEDRWHVHDFEAALNAATIDRPILRWLANGWMENNYRKKGDNRSRLAMVHAWVTLPNPDGVFADYNRIIPYLQLGLPEDFANGASEAAARGLALTTEGGCNYLLDGPLWIANVEKSRKTRLLQSCESAATSLKTALRAGKEAVNEAGVRAWVEFDRIYQASLTSEQKRRIAAITEHSAHDAPAPPEGAESTHSHSH